MHQRGTIPFEAIDAVHAGSTTLVNQRVAAETAAMPRTGQQAFSRAAELEGMTAARPLFSEGLALRKLPSGNPFPHDMAGGRPVGEKPTLRVEQSAFADGHLPTDM